MPSEGRGGLSDADVQRIAAQLAGRLHGQGGKGDRAPLLPTVRRGGKGKSKGRGQTGGGGGEGKGGNERGTTWRCSSCGEPRNFAHREECFRCYAPRRPEPHRQPAHRPTAPRPKPDGKDARGSLSAPHSGPLRPNASRAYQGPVGADGQRPLFKRYLEDEARKKQRQGTEAAGGDDSKGADDGDDGFLLLSRAKFSTSSSCDGCSWNRRWCTQARRPPDGQACHEPRTQDPRDGGKCQLAAPYHFIPHASDDAIPTVVGRSR